MRILFVIFSTVLMAAAIARTTEATPAPRPESDLLRPCCSECPGDTPDPTDPCWQVCLFDC